MKHFFIAALVLVVASVEAGAEIIAECGPASGYSFFLQGRFVPVNRSGWSKDTISKGSTSIVSVEGKFDVLYSDGISKNRSSRADGAEVIPLGMNTVEKSVTLLVIYKNRSAEIYTYHGLSKSLIHQPVRYNATINSAKMMVSNCN